MASENDRKDAARVLVVDDERENLLALEASLSCLGQEVVPASNGEEALKLVLKQDFAVIVLDVVMPGMDGFETAELIRSRARSRHTPIIFLTARTFDEKNILRGYALGAVDYIVKPFDTEILRSKVSFFIELYDKSRLLRQQTRLLKEMMVRERSAATALARRAEELARSNTELEQFAYVTSHDLQEPLRTVASHVQLLARSYKGKLDGEADEIIQTVVDGVSRMHSMIRDLLTYSRAGKSDEKKCDVDLNDVASSVITTLSAPIQEAGARVSVHSLPVVPGQRTQLHCLLQNLVENAVKFRGTAPPEIELSAERDGVMWQITVKDNGIGIDPRYADQVFQMFRRLHTREVYPGTGLGLSIARKIVENAGGRIWVESALGRGSEFKLTLPVAGHPLRRPREELLDRLLMGDDDFDSLDQEI